MESLWDSVSFFFFFCMPDNKKQGGKKMCLSVGCFESPKNKQETGAGIVKSVATVNQWQRCMLVDSRSCRERLLGGLGSTASTWSLGLLLLSMPLLFLLFFFSFFLFLFLLDAMKTMTTMLVPFLQLTACLLTPPRAVDHDLGSKRDSRSWNIADLELVPDRSEAPAPA